MNFINLLIYYKKKVKNYKLYKCIYVINRCKEMINFKFQDHLISIL